MAGSALNVQQGRDFIFYDALYASTNAMPADSAPGTSPGAPWRDVGYTDGGIGFNIGTSYDDVRVDQEVDLVAVIPTGRDIRITAQMAEFTLTNLQAAIGQGSTSTVAASSGVRGHTDLAMSNTIAVTYRSALAAVKRSLSNDQEDFRIAIWRGQCRSAVQSSFQAGAKTIIPYEIQAFPDPNNSNRVMMLRQILAALP